MLENPTGVYALRCLSYYGGFFFSPIYNGFVWSTDWKKASCTLELDEFEEVPCDRHGPTGGCGFHGVWEFNSVRDFIRSIQGQATVIVLAEYAGKIVAHERGLRASFCRVRAVLDWDVKAELSAWQWGVPMMSPPNLVPFACKHFSAPLIHQRDIPKLVDGARNKISVTKDGFSNLAI